MKKKVYDVLIIEIILAIIFYGFLYINSGLRHQLWQTHREIFLLIFFSPLLIVMLILELWQKKAAKFATFNRWLMTIFWPVLSLGGWLELMNILVKAWPNGSAVTATIFTLMGLIILVPFAMVVTNKVEWTIPRLILIFWTMETIMEASTLGHIPGNRFYDTILSTGLWAAFVYIIFGCFLAQGWGFSFNFNLKFEKTTNFSKDVLAFLIIFNVVAIIWNAFSGNGDNLLSILFSYHMDPMKFTLNSFSEAAEAGLLEEMNRYLVIIVLLFAMRNRKYQVSLTILISSLFFGLLHFTNFGWQELAPTIAQVTYAFGIGLVFAVVYLYTGKLWLTMLLHFATDFLVFVQENGDKPGSWSGNAGDWIVAVITLVVPVCIYLWMITGKRKLVLEENSSRILAALTK